MFGAVSICDTPVRFTGLISSYVEVFNKPDRCKHGNPILTGYIGCIARDLQPKEAKTNFQRSQIGF